MMADTVKVREKNKGCISRSTIFRDGQSRYSRDCTQCK